MKIAKQTTASEFWDILGWHVNRRGLSNGLVADLLKSAQVSSNYQGIHGYHQIPRACTNLSDFTIIINVGLHFVTVYGTPEYVMYIDSMGLPPTRVEVKEFLAQCRRPFVYNISQVQGDTSSYCGLYAALFVIFLDYRHSGKINSTWKLQFHVAKWNESEHDITNRLKSNDERCVTLIKVLLQHKNDVNMQ